ncbi:MAG TPA: DUF6448 family protein [Thermoanaerobaculia bacterium]|nr:DUF6448 family protein [Thermoanaerobaculia bacterium]
MLRSPLRVAIAAFFLAAVATARPAAAHCDTLDGPVVADARAALESGAVDPVLKWVAPASEAEVRRAFDEVSVVRRLGPAAEALADRSFFETVVRLHRASEGEPFTGVKAAGTEVSPAVRAADRSLETGSADDLVRLVTDRDAAFLRERFARVREARRHASESVAAGRAYVRAYVEYVHAAESLFDAGSAPAESEHPKR